LTAIRVLRALVITELVFLILAIPLTFLPDDTPDEVNSYLNGAGAGPLIQLFDSESNMAALTFGSVIVAFIVTYVLCLVGLLRLKSWARKLYVALFVVGTCIYPLLGTSLIDPISGTVEYLAAVCTGAILATLFVSDARTHFERTPNNSFERTREG
jgi:hypothetical protein